MLRCIAIDDEPLALELLEDNITKVPYLQLVAACDNPLDAMKVMREHTVDLVFLDIQMPGLTGLQFIQSQPAQQCMFVLITAYEKYALQGFNLNVVDYLVKPVELDRFIKACNKAWELHQLRTKGKAFNETGAADFFFVNVEYSLVKVQKPDIVYVEGLKDYLKIHLRSTPKPVITRMSMKSIEEQLSSASFIRIHKSYIVSVASITSVRKSTVYLGEVELPLSENYRDAFFKIIGKAE